MMEQFALPSEFRYPLGILNLEDIKCDGQLSYGLFKHFFGLRVQLPHTYLYGQVTGRGICGD